jgi:tetratricopeptide (TPR) repeat protein
MARLERKPTRRPTPIAGTASIPPPVDAAQNHFNQGYRFFKDGEYRRALLSLEKAHQEDPEHALYMTFYAYSLFQVDPSRAKDARRLLEKAIDSENLQALPDAHLFLGKIWKVENKPHRAYRHFREALELNPSSRDAEREIRLHEKKHAEKSEGLFKKLFKK